MVRNTIRFFFFFEGTRGNCLKYAFWVKFREIQYAWGDTGCMGLIAISMTFAQAAPGAQSCGLLCLSLATGMVQVYAECYSELAAGAHGADAQSRSV